MYAIFESGGKQYKVQEGDMVFLEKLEAGEDETITIDKVLILGKDGGAVIGSPTVAGATITAKVLKQGKGKKLTVFTYKPKKNQKRKLGHRQPYTKVLIEKIAG
ncbi:MAG: 50S ribosomal protein L21 [Oscillospiraceae bacterium]|nr:50S ribosomal protein L21 [Oscillospiraceae bacterium]